LTDNISHLAHCACALLKRVGCLISNAGAGAGSAPVKRPQGHDTKHHVNRSALEVVSNPVGCAHRIAQLLRRPVCDIVERLGRHVTLAWTRGSQKIEHLLEPEYRVCPRVANHRFSEFTHT
jgi:hypothetical protein